jgi:hypothetical protein
VNSKMLLFFAPNFASFVIDVLTIFCLSSCVFCYELNILMINLHIQSSIAMIQNKLTN